MFKKFFKYGKRTAHNHVDVTATCIGGIALSQLVTVRNRLYRYGVALDREKKEIALVRFDERHPEGKKIELESVEATRTTALLGAKDNGLNITIMYLEGEDILSMCITGW